MANAIINTQMNVLRNFCKQINKYFEHNHKNVALIWGCCLLILIAYLDYQVSPKIYLSVLHLLPIALITWFVSKESGFITCGLSAVAGLINRLRGDDTEISILLELWNTTVWLIVFMTVSSLLFQLREALKQEEELGRTDSITGVANKRLFLELAGMEVKKTYRYRHPITIIDIDIDDFKTINKKFGYHVGNQILYAAAQTIRNHIRETDIIGRIGEDEFAIVLPGSGYESADIVLSRLKNQLLEAMKKNHWSATFSMAAVTFVAPPSSVEEMIQQADYLMYLVKNDGQDQLQHETYTCIKS